MTTRPSPAITQMSDAFLTYLIEKRGQNLFVILNRAGTSCLKDPGLNQPFSTSNRKQADLIAKESGGVVVTLSEGLNILTRNNLTHSR